MNLEARDLHGFFGEIVTSSPIERKQTDNEAGIDHSASEDYTSTWSALLRDYRGGARPKICKPAETHTSRSNEESSSSYEPLAQSSVKVLLTPGRKMHVLSSSTRKFHRQATPKRPSTYSKLSKAYNERFKGSSEEDLQDEESIQTIKTKLRSTNKALTLEDINKYEKIVQRHVARQGTPKTQGAVPTVAIEAPQQNLLADSELMRFVEHQIGDLNLTPSSKRVIKMQEQQQERRLIGLSITKRKSAVDIRKKIQHQQVMAKQQVKDREEHEMKLIRAAKQRQKALTASTLFSQARAAHHQRVVKEVRLKGNIDQLQRQLQSEKAKNNLQANKIVRDVWSTFLHDQYGEMRQELHRQREEQKEVAKGSEAQLQRLKASYEEKLRELKGLAAEKAVEAGLEKKEVAYELDRIRRAMERQFQAEFASLLQKIETKGDHKRFMRDDKASGVKQQLLKADYVFNM